MRSLPSCRERLDPDLPEATGNLRLRSTRPTLINGRRIGTSRPAPHESGSGTYTLSIRGDALLARHGEGRTKAHADRNSEPADCR